MMLNKWRAVDNRPKNRAVILSRPMILARNTGMLAPQKMVYKLITAMSRIKFKLRGK